MGEGLLVINTDFKIAHINPTAERLLETTASEAIGKEWSTFITVYVGDKRLEMAQASIYKAIKDGNIYKTEPDDNHFYQSRSGKKFPVASVTAPLIANGKVTGAVKVFHDISKEKHDKTIIEQEVRVRTQELHQEEAKLASSINSLQIGFVMTDVTNKILMANPAAKNILGLSEMPKSLTEVQALFGGHFELVKHSKESCDEKKQRDFRDIKLGGKYLHLYFTPILLGAAEHTACIGTVILIEDSTEARVLERSKDEFFTIASHELRTPLTAIRGNAELILTHFTSQITDDRFRQMISDMYAASMRLIEIVNDFLDMSRLEQGRMQFAQAAFNISKTANEVVGELGTLANTKGLKLDIAQNDPLPEVWADPKLTKQVVINLISNAIKFTEKGSVTIRLSHQNDHVVVEVQDTGKGIAPEMQSLLFRKFQQAGESLITRDTTKGTGVGLYISKLLVEGMGGSIQLKESVPGKGSTFTFTLPVAKDSH